jgi:hypothetical protein
MSIFEAVFDRSLVEGRGGVSKESLAVWFVFTKFTFEICSICIEDLSVAIFHAISKISNESVTVTVNNLRMTIEYTPFPKPIDSNFPRDNIVGSPPMPKIKLPLAFIHFLGVTIVICSESMPEVVLEATVVLITVRVVHGTLNRC